MGKYNKRSVRGDTASPQDAPRDLDPIRDNPGLARIAQWLSRVKFRKNFFGGVVEADVWKKLDELNRLYEDALIAERARYDTLLHLKDLESIVPDQEEADPDA